MKKLFIALLALASSVPAAMSQAIVFDKTEVDLGKIEVANLKDGKVTYDFHFTNTGDKPLVIKTILPSCGCVVAFDKTQQYEAGQSGVMRFEAVADRFRELDQFFTIDIYSTAKNYGIQKGVHNLKVKFSVDELYNPEQGYFSLNVDSKHSDYVYAPTDVYETILGRVSEELRDTYYNDQSDSVVESLVSLLQKDGSYHHIDYDCVFRTTWQPGDHLEALRTMSACYAEPQSKYYQDHELFAAITKALKFWLAKHPRSHNWWHNEIGGSQIMADLLVLLSTAELTLDDDMMAALCHTIANSDPARYTGANKLDIARHTLYRGCLLKDSELVSFAASEIYYPVMITPKEGIQEDMAYHQHGPHLYIGGYGIVFADGISQLAATLEGTPYQLDKERLDIFANFLLKGYFTIFRAEYMDWSAVGRSVSREDILDNKKSASLILDRMMRIDPSRADQYRDIKKRVVGDVTPGKGVKEQNIDYYRTDYMVHNREDYQATVRTASVRMNKAENGNGENLLSTYLSDGAFNIRQSGDEYYNIFAYWQWDKVPGVTSPKRVYNLSASWMNPGTAKQTGGVSNGKFGAYAYNHDDHGFVAKKGWFFFDDFVVALGAAIKADSVDLQTTLDQCYLNGDVVVGDADGKQKSYESFDAMIDSPKYIIHNNMGYMPLMDGSIYLDAGRREGNWNVINYNERNDAIYADLFTLVWDHPKSNNPQQYAYIQMPKCKNGKQMAKIAKQLQVVNNSDKQVVAFDDVTMALLYKAGSFDVDGTTVSVDRAAMVIVDAQGKESNMSVVNLDGDSAPVAITISKGGKSIASYSVATDVMKSEQLKNIKL